MIVLLTWVREKLAIVFYLPADAREVAKFAFFLPVTDEGTMTSTFVVLVVAEIRHPDYLFDLFKLLS
jgi:hypothetical protein